jgi:hypothetical protein
MYFIDFGEILLQLNYSMNSLAKNELPKAEDV